MSNNEKEKNGGQLFWPPEWFSDIVFGWIERRKKRKESLDVAEFYKEHPDLRR